MSRTLKLIFLMTSFIIISKDKAQQNLYLEKFYKSHSISKFDTTTLTTEGSVGIELIRSMQKSISLKPYQSMEKSVVIENAQNLTIEAQNALLKILEEPPLNTFIFLIATNEDFLPTVLSRCQVIKLDRNYKEIEISKKTNEDLQVILYGSLGDKLSLAEKISSDKGETEKWFSGVLTLLQDGLIKDPTDLTILTAIEKIQEGYKTYKTTNANLRLILEHTFLGIRQKGIGSSV